MKTVVSRTLAALVLAALACLLLAGAAPRSGGSAEPGKLVILSTSDVKGKLDPCG
jgi:hypothetical protein